MPNEIIQIKMSDIYKPMNIRQNAPKQALKELGQSIIENGLLQPIGVIRKDYTAADTGEKYKYELVYGYRRAQAFTDIVYADKAPSSIKIPALVLKAKTSNAQKAIIKLVENLVRLDLSPMEEAWAIRDIMEQHKLNATTLATKIGKSSGFVSQRLKLLDLSSEIQRALAGGAITPTHARELGRIGDAKQQEKLAAKAANMSAAAFKEKVEDYLEKQNTPKSTRGRKKKKTTWRSPEAVEEALDTIKDNTAGVSDAETKIFLKGLWRGISWVTGRLETNELMSD